MVPQNGMAAEWAILIMYYSSSLLPLASLSSIARGTVVPVLLHVFGLQLHLTLCAQLFIIQHVSLVEDDSM